MPKTIHQDELITAIAGHTAKFGHTTLMGLVDDHGRLPIGVLNMLDAYLPVWRAKEWGGSPEGVFDEATRDTSMAAHIRLHQGLAKAISERRFK